MRKNLIISTIALCLISLFYVSAHAQTSTISDLNARQADIIAQNADITRLQSQQAAITAAIAVDNANIVTDNNIITQDNAIIAQYNANNATNITGVNWDYYAQLETAAIRFSQFSAVNNGINWPNIITQLNITCPVAESSVNWPNWPNCESKGVVGGQPYGNWTSGWQGFYCGQGSIAGTC